MQNNEDIKTEYEETFFNSRNKQNDYNQRDRLRESFDQDQKRKDERMRDLELQLKENKSELQTQRIKIINLENSLKSQISGLQQKDERMGDLELQLKENKSELQNQNLKFKNLENLLKSQISDLQQKHERMRDQELQLIEKNSQKKESICPICQEEFSFTRQNKITICNHKFHADCLQKSLLRSRACPLCRRQI